MMYTPGPCLPAHGCPACDPLPTICLVLGDLLRAVSSFFQEACRSLSEEALPGSLGRGIAAIGPSCGLLL